MQSYWNQIHNNFGPQSTSIKIRVSFWVGCSCSDRKAKRIKYCKILVAKVTQSIASWMQHHIGFPKSISSFSCLLPITSPFSYVSFNSSFPVQNSSLFSSNYLSLLYGVLRLKQYSLLAAQSEFPFPRSGSQCEFHTQAHIESISKAEYVLYRIWCATYENVEQNVKWPARRVRERTW